MNKSKKSIKTAVYIRTFGCQMNKRDSEALLGLFLEKGYTQVESEAEAEVILINTCSVRDHAENRAISYAGSLKKLTVGCRTKDVGCENIPHPTSHIPRIIGLIGCMARNRGEELFKKMSHLGLICGPASFAKIPAYIEKIRKDQTRIIDLDDGLRDEEMYRAAFRIEPDHAQVVISTGCSNYCTYCVVPYVRGELRLRKPEDIIDEVKRNIDLGIKKITLLGQNVNDYKDFVGLLCRVEKIEGLEELNFITSQPRNIPDGLFELMVKSKKISNHLHLPFQSGSNRILKKMNRGYTKEKYLQLTDDYKKIVKGTLSTDVIVGFPGETDSDFNQTREILEKVRFKYAYIFKYSPRTRAQSAKVDDDIPETVKAQRHKVLLDLQKSISLSK
jgi:tRNA-2-methylthio-N6-dimethylallyladenosine synthase